MIASWMVYVVLVTLLLTVAGVALEPALHRWGMALRWVWVGGLAASVTVPLAGWLIPRERPEGALAGIGDLILVGGPATTTPSSPPARLVSPDQLDGLLLVGWLAASLLVLGMFAAAVLRLRRDRRHWQPTEMEGREVFISRSTGPAVLGLRRMTIVLPEWALTLPEDRRHLLIRHEEEHITARDPYLLVLAAIPLLVIPWAVPVWWQHRRLRAAIEIDCDRRVLAGHPTEARTYGDLLIAVGSMLGTRPSPFGSLAAGATQLERRIRMIANPWKFSARVVLGFAGLAALLIAGACALQPPLRAATDEGGTAGSGSGSRTATPAIRNGTAEVSAAPMAAVTLRATTDPVDPPEEAPPLAPTPKASPAAPVPEVPLAAPAPEAPPIADIASPGAVATDTIPEFTPFEERPHFLGRVEFGRALEANYPPQLREAGVGGQVVLWVYIDETGAVGYTRLVRSSGYPELDQVAQDLMRTAARFTPARNDGAPVAVWVQLPVTFQP